MFPGRKSRATSCSRHLWILGLFGKSDRPEFLGIVKATRKRQVFAPYVEVAGYIRPLETHRASQEQSDGLQTDH